MTVTFADEVVGMGMLFQLARSSLHWTMRSAWGLDASLRRKVKMGAVGWPVRWGAMFESG